MATPETHCQENTNETIVIVKITHTASPKTLFCNCTKLNSSANQYSGGGYNENVLHDYSCCKGVTLTVLSGNDDITVTKIYKKKCENFT